MARGDIGDRVRALEAVETGRRLAGALPVCARLDGRGFSRFTRDMARPFDPGMTAAMIATATELVARSGARVAFVQSDEVSLLFERNSPEAGLLFDGKVQKVVSVLAGIAAAKFAREVAGRFPHKADALPHFDCRAFGVPSREAAAEAILWRTLDARRNALNQVAHHHLGDRATRGVGWEGRVAMLRERGVDPGAHPVENMRGAFVRRVTRTRGLDAGDLARIPEGRRPETVERSSVEVVPMPPLWRVGNAVEVLFDGAEPVLRQGKTDGGEGAEASTG